MIIHDVQQRSDAWMKLRAGIPTASEFDKILTPEFKMREGATLLTYRNQKITERILQRPELSFSGGDLEQGTILEDEALPWYQLSYNDPVARVGFVTTDDGKYGCSPDGMRGLPALFRDGKIPSGEIEINMRGVEGIEGLEIKCPKSHTHVGYLLGGVLPKDYAAQVHGSMFVTGAKSWKFLSYHRGFPAFLMTVERDEEIQKKIGTALKIFSDLVDLGMKQITSIMEAK